MEYLSEKGCVDGHRRAHDDGRDGSKQDVIPFGSVRLQDPQSVDLWQVFVFSLGLNDRVLLDKGTFASTALTTAMRKSLYYIPTGQSYKQFTLAIYESRVIM